MAWRFYDNTGAEKVVETSGGGGGGDPAMGGDLTGTASTAQIATGAIVNADVNVAAAIALSKLATDPLARANHTGTQLASTVSDFDTQVRLSRLDQMALPTAAVPMGSQKLTGLAAGSSNGDSLRYEQLIGQYLLLSGGTLTGNLSVANDLTVNHASGTSQVFINALAAQESVLKLRSGGTTMWSLSRQPTSDDFWMYNQTAGATAFTIAKTTNIVDFNETPTKDGSTIWHAGNDGAASTLDADLLDAQHGTYYLARANHSGTQLASTISDFDTQVRTSRLDQMALPTAAVPMGSQKITGLAAGTANGDALRYEQLIGAYLLLSGGTLTGNLTVDRNGAATTGRVTVDVDAGQQAGYRLSEDGTPIWEMYKRSANDDFRLNNEVLASPVFTVDVTTNVVNFNEAPTKDGSAIWHAGNDGAASGLDADLLDAQHGTYYLDRANHSGTQAATTITIVDAAGDFTATEVEGALAELQSDHEADATALSDHISDATDAHDASAISIADTNGVYASTDVEGALEEAAPGMPYYVKAFQAFNPDLIALSADPQQGSTPNALGTTLSRWVAVWVPPNSPDIGGLQFFKANTSSFTSSTGNICALYSADATYENLTLEVQTADDDTKWQGTINTTIEWMFTSAYTPDPAGEWVWIWLNYRSSAGTAPQILHHTNAGGSEYPRAFSGPYAKRNCYYSGTLTAPPATRTMAGLTAYAQIPIIALVAS